MPASAAAARPVAPMPRIFTAPVVTSPLGQRAQVAPEARGESPTRPGRRRRRGAPAAPPRPAARPRASAPAGRGPRPTAAPRPPTNAGPSSRVTGSPAVVGPRPELLVPPGGRRVSARTPPVPPPRRARRPGHCLTHARLTSSSHRRRGRRHRRWAAVRPRRPDAVVTGLALLGGGRARDRRDTAGRASAVSTVETCPSASSSSRSALIMPPLRRPSPASPDRDRAPDRRSSRREGQRDERLALRRRRSRVARGGRRDHDGQRRTGRGLPAEGQEARPLEAVQDLPAAAGSSWPLRGRLLGRPAPTPARAPSGRTPSRRPGKFSPARLSAGR